MEDEKKRKRIEISIDFNMPRLSRIYRKMVYLISFFDIIIGCYNLLFPINIMTSIGGLFFIGTGLIGVDLIRYQKKISENKREAGIWT